MSQKQVKGRRKDGNGVQSSVRHIENDGNDFGMVSRRNGWSVRMKKVMYGCQCCCCSPYVLVRLSLGFPPRDS